MNTFYKAIFHDKWMGASFGLFTVFSLWWAWLGLSNATFDQIQVWAVLYQVTALFGAIVGLSIARKWGGFKSMMGRAALMFSIGLFCQSFAQSAGSYLAWKLGTVPYPSLSDVGAFGALIFYSLGVIFLANASGAHVSLRSYKGKFVAVIIPVIFLVSSFTIFLRSYEFDWSQPLTTFLDIGYPLGEAFYVSMAILAYLLSRKMLGGIMRIPILTFIVALIAEYVADFLFLYDSHAGAYVYGGFNDLLFVVSYSLMSMSVIQLGVTFNTIRNTHPTESNVVGVLQGVTSIFSQMASKIIQEQAFVIGPLAWTEAGKVGGLQVSDMQKGEVIISNDEPSAVVDKLVAQYERLFGQASREVCRQAVTSFISTMSPADIPLSLRS